MKRILLSALLSAAWLTGAAQQDTLTMSLEQCVAYAMDRSYGRQSIQLNEQVREVVYDQSKLERLPGLSGSAAQSVSHTDSASWSGSYKLGMDIPIFQGGQVNNSIKQNKLSLEQSELRTAQYDNNLTIGILQAFLNALGNEELLKYQTQMLAASREQARQGEQRLGVGDILESDYLLFEAQLAMDENNIVETTIARNNSLYALKNLLSMDLETQIKLIYPDTTALESMLALPRMEYVVERSVGSLPEVRISDYDVEIAATGLKISRAALYPSLSLSGGLSTGVRDFDNYGQQLSDGFTKTAGLNLSIPIFNKGRTRSGIAQSQIALQQAELDRLQTEVDLRQTLMNEYGNVESAASKYSASSKRENAYARSFAVYRSMFREGAITPVELLQQQNNYIGAMNDYIQSKYGFMLKRKILDVYMGEPVVM